MCLKKATELLSKSNILDSNESFDSQAVQCKTTAQQIRKWIDFSVTVDSILRLS
jgi:hypothetical protein